MKKYIDFIKKVQAISQIGLTYSNDPYAIDNYSLLKKEAIEMLENFRFDELSDKDIYKNNYYPTPQISVRALIIQDGKILYCKEKEDGKYSIPGGWVDIDSSPKEAIIKEVFEESGYHVKVERLLAVIDRRKYLKKSLYDVIQLFFYCEIVGGTANPNYEIEELIFKEINDYPNLSTKTTKQEMEIILNVLQNKLDTHIE